MTKTVLLVSLLFVLAGPVMAYENFIPSGQGYSTEVDSVAEIDSARDKLNAQTDIIESDIYRKAREEQLKDSYMRRFFSEHEGSGSNFNIDY